MPTASSSATPGSASGGSAKWWWHALLVALAAFGATLLSVREPQFGDDFKYWTYGYNVHEQGLAGWTDDGFHQLRWPIWGLLWLAQSLFGYGPASYYFQPFLMIMLGSVCAFTLGRILFQRPSLAWCCAVLFMFHPIFDVNLTRPYPDVAEGVLGTCAVFAWWRLMEAETRGRIVVSSLLCGVFLFLAEENRLTGVFFVPLIGCLTLLFFRHRFLRVFLPIAVFGVLLCGQMAFYHWKFGEWNHFIAANSRAKGRRGTEAVKNLFGVPFRFLGALYKGNPLLACNAVFGLVGCWFAWRRFGRPGRIVLAWFVLLYLAYACAPQKLWPFRPMLRNADRFLSALVVPYTALAIMGLVGVLGLPAKWPRTRAAVAFLQRRSALACFLGALVVIGLSLAPVGDRPFFNLGYIPKFSAYMRALPEHTTVFTHREGMLLARLVDNEAAQRLQWLADDKWITEADKVDATVLERVKKASEFWYVRKLVMMRFAKGIDTEDEDAKIYSQPKLAPWFDAPEKDWKLMQVLVNSDNPDTVLYTRRMPQMPAATIYTVESPELKGLLPRLPFSWKQGDTDFRKTPIEFDWPLPPHLRGRKVRVEMEGKSDKREPLTVRVSFGKNKKFDPDLALKFYFFRDGGKDFLCVPVPADADTMHVRVRFSEHMERVTVSAFRMIVD